MQEWQFRAKALAHGFKHLGDMAQIGARVPRLLHRKGARFACRASGWLVVVPLARARRRCRYPVHGLKPRDSGLHPDGFVAHIEVLLDRVQQLGDGTARGVPISKRPFTGLPSE